MRRTWLAANKGYCWSLFASQANEDKKSSEWGSEESRPQPLGDHLGNDSALMWFWSKGSHKKQVAMLLSP